MRLIAVAKRTAVPESRGRFSIGDYMLDCKSSSCYFADDKRGQRTNEPCSCLYPMNDKKRMDVIKHVANLKKENILLRNALRSISSYVPFDETGDAAENVGLTPYEYIELSYDNIINEAKSALYQ